MRDDESCMTYFLLHFTLLRVCSAVSLVSGEATHFIQGLRRPKRDG